MNFDDCPIKDLTDIEKISMNLLESMEKNIRQFKMEDKDGKHIANRVAIMRKFCIYVTTHLLSLLSNKFDKNVDLEKLEYDFFKINEFVNNGLLEVHSMLFKDKKE